MSKIFHNEFFEKGDSDIDRLRFLSGNRAKRVGFYKRKVWDLKIDSRDHYLWSKNSRSEKYVL